MDNPDEKRPTTRILLAEDHEVVRSGLRSLLDNQTGFKVVAEAANGLQVLELIEQGIAADVILTDINMPGMNGIELIGKLSSMGNTARLIVLSMLDNEKFVTRALKAGADGYLLKNISANELTFAIKHVMNGGEYVCTEIAMRIIKRLVKTPEVAYPENNIDLQLTERDQEVLSLLSDGYTNQEIADKLFTSKRTVEGYRQSLMNRTGCKNTASLVKFAMVNRLL